MIFFRKKQEEPEDNDDEQEEIEHVTFKGPLNGAEVNFKENARLVQAALVSAKDIVSDALSRRAERFRLEPKGKAGIVTIMVDGIPYAGARMPANQALAVTQMIKLLAGLDIKERKKAQSGGMKAEYEETPYELTVNITPLPDGGERLTVSSRNLKVKLETPDELGFSEQMKTTIREKASTKQGIMLVTGGPFSGVTTAMYGVVRTIDAYLYQIYSVADTGGRELRNVTPFEGNPGDTLDASIQRVKRLESDVLFMDPVRDAEQAKLMCKWAEVMCLLSEIPGKDAASAMYQFVQWVGAEEATKNLSLVVCPRLIRTLCDKCKETYRPNPKLIQKVGLPPETTRLFRPATPFEPEKPGDEPPPPCEKCGDMYYYGRAGMYEMVVMSDEMKAVIKAGGDVAAIKAQAKKEKMQSFHSEGLRLVAQGKTSLEELQRVFKGG